MSKFEMQVKMEFMIEADNQQHAESKTKALLEKMEAEVDQIKTVSRRKATSHGVVQG